MWSPRRDRAGWRRSTTITRHFVVVVIVFTFVLFGNPAVSAFSVPSSSSSSSEVRGDGNDDEQRRRRQRRNDRVERVAVVGAGIAGLSLAHALTNDARDENADDPDARTPPRVTIFDSRPSLEDTDGAGVQINGGVSVLRRINPALQRRVTEVSTPLSKIRSRTTPWFPFPSFGGDESSSSSSSSFSTLLELDLRDCVRREGGDAERELVDPDDDERTLCRTVMRGTLQRTLLEELPPTRTSVEFGKELVGLSDDLRCTFADGTVTEPFDLVVGCDGIRSAVREYVDAGTLSSSPDGRRRAPRSLYSGLRVQFAVRDGELLAPEDERRDDHRHPNQRPVELRQYFGNGGYGLSGTYGNGLDRAPSKLALLVFQDPDYFGPFPKRKRSDDVAPASSSSSATAAAASSSSSDENADWTQSVRMKGDDPRTAFLRRVEAASILDHELRPVAEEADRLFELGVYFHNPFLRSWRRRTSAGKFCVLAGDAAHALPPFLGQGANQAIQDAYCLAERIREYNNNDDDDDDRPDLDELLRRYESRRWWPTTELCLKSAFLGYLEAGSEGFPSRFRDVFFFVMGKIGVARKVFLGGATPKV